MDLVNVLKYAVVIIAVALVVSISLQSRSGGLSTMFGGGGGGEAYRSKRGAEAFLYNSTIVLAILLVTAAMAIAILSV